MLSHDMSGAKLASTKPRNLPNRILRAIDGALNIQGLPKCVRPTLAAICRFVSQAEPFATIFAHKDTIAKRTGASEETIYRHLRTLKTLDLISVLDQERKSRNGRFAVSRIRLTKKAAVLLGLVAAEEDPFSDEFSNSPGADQPSFPAPTIENTAEMSNENSSEIAVIHSTPNVKMTDGHTLSEPTLSNYQPPQPAPTKNCLPVDLAWMSGNGLSKAGIFGLMGLAKQNKKRLSDIVTVLHERIKDMKGRELFAYVASICKGPSDFAVAAANLRRQLADAEVAQMFKRKCAIFRERFKGVSLTDKSQSTLYVIDKKAMFVQVYGKRPGSAPLTDLTTWIDAIESGKLVLATLQVERQLMQM